MKLTKVILLLVLIGCQTQHKPSITKIDKAFLKKEVLGKDVQLVDVRTPEEYEAGHIADAVNFNIIDNETFLEQVETLNKEEPVYLYCKMGGRSNRAAALMEEMGFKKIFDYSRGYSDWISD